MRRKSAFKGSRGARRGAATAVNTISRPTRPPIAESVFRREKRASSMARAVIGGSAVSDTRVEAGVAQVGQHVDADEDYRVEQDEVLGDDDVAVGHGGEEGPPPARQP